MKQPKLYVFGGIFSSNQIKLIEDISTPSFFPKETKALIDHPPDVIVTIGESFMQFPEMVKLELRLKRKWLHYNSADEFVKRVFEICHCHIAYAIESHNSRDLISVFTTSYKSEDKILRPFKSLLNQRYKYWEWVIMDDTDGDANFNDLKRLKDTDPRIRIYKSDKNSGVIGQVKNVASSLCRGRIIAELDHDDILSPDCLERLYDAFEKHPDAGFAATDFCEIFEDGSNWAYGEFFGRGYGTYRKEFVRVRPEESPRWINIGTTIPINGVTMRHIVGVPNHIRAWTRECLHKLGGYNPYLHVADDYELLIRTFLTSKMIRIPHMCYFQFRNAGGNNFTFIRNAEIQKLVKAISGHYHEAIAKRCKELGIVDNYDGYSKYGNRKAWLDNSDYEPRMDYVTRICAVSVLVVCDDKTNLHLLQANLEQIATQRGVDFALYVIGAKAGNMEAHMHTSAKWWNLQEGTLDDARVYACKMLIDGTCDSVYLWELEDKIFSDDTLADIVRDGTKLIPMESFKKGYDVLRKLPTKS